jgi:anaerobic selenocysteine-containing dehydrogenase
MLKRPNAAKRAGNLRATRNAVILPQECPNDDALTYGKCIHNNILFHEANSCPEFWEQTRLIAGINVAVPLIKCAESVLIAGINVAVPLIKCAESVEGFERLRKTVDFYNIDFVRYTCGVESEPLNKLIDYIADSKSLGIIHGMGLTQHVTGSENVHTLLNLMILKKRPITVA